jgi:glycosyltransferase involved in cell wall biosynthesis
VRVGLNLVFLSRQGGGIGRYATQLLPALLAADPELELVAFHGSMLPPELREVPGAERIEWVDLRAAPTQRRNLAVQLVALPMLARRRGCELVHSPANVGPLAGVPTVVTITDLIWLHEPERWESRSVARRTRLLAVSNARRARRVIAISHATGDDLMRSLGLPEDKIDVTPLGVGVPREVDPEEVAAVRSRLGLDGRPLLLCVAQKRPYKNQAAIVRALPELGADPVAILPGASTDYERELRALAEHLGVSERVLFPEYVSERELEALYAAATCLVLPSLIEGFGLPVLEAMARGVPVACSDRASLPEVAGDAGLLFDPLDQSAVTFSLRRLLEDAELRRELSRRGRERAGRFTWEQTARRTLASYERALE